MSSIEFLRSTTGRAQRTLRFDCGLQLSNACTGRKASAFRLQRDDRVDGGTRWFLSDPSLSPARARIQRLRPLLSDNDVYIKVERMVCLSDLSDVKTGRNYCAAQRRQSSTQPRIYRRARRQSCSKSRFAA